MNTPHKHAALIKAWADGATIQFLSPDGKWEDSESPPWWLWLEYRIKPEPEADLVYPLHLSSGGGVWFNDKSDWPNNMVCTFDGKTKQLKSVRMMGKPDPEAMEYLLRGMLDSRGYSFCTQRSIENVLEI